ncbi:MAG: class I SAM-dependent methyltransferase [Caulobacteraceae bacterium]|nr:class I SAM-dependent methyltransferase [Caulobacteraceae bacterium]
MSLDLWNNRFAGETYVFGEEPNAFLARQQARLPRSGRALAVADGEGRNGVWLAQQGLSVHSVDGSSVAQGKAGRLAAARGVALELELADLSDWSWPESTYDVVAAIFIQFAGPELRAAMFAGMKRSLKPGGLLLIEGYRPEQIAYGTGGPRVVENLYTEAMLAEAFAEFEILELAAYDAEIQEGPGHSGMSALVDLVARKPG